MTNIFFIDTPQKLEAVYGSGIESLGLDTKKYYTKADLTEKKDELRNVKNIFSTWYMPILTKEEIKEFFPSLEAVYYAAGTVKYFAEPYLDLGIKVYSAEAANAVPVAEFAYAEILLANKGFYKSQALYKKFRFKKARNIAFSHTGNFSSTVGIIGAGKIGRLVIDYLSRHDIRVLVYDKYLTDAEISAMGAKSATLDEIFSQCDVISNHLPDTEETRNMLGFNQFINMKKNATFINTGRGRQVDESGLVKALRKRRDLSAVLDVSCHEPAWPWSGLYRCKNVFMTPHIAGSVGLEQKRMAEYMLRTYNQKGKASPYEITKEMLDKMSYDR